MKSLQNHIPQLINKSKNTFCTHNTSQHVAMYFTQKSKKSFNILSIGYNYFTRNKSIHAEMDATNKLKPTKKTQNVNLLVIRFNGITQLNNSMPCCFCVFYLNTRLKQQYGICSF